MKTTFVEIREEGSGRRRLKKAIGDQFVIGRGARAEVPLSFAKELDPHHLLCVPGEAGVWMSVAEGARAPLAPGGATFRRGTVPWGTAIQLAGLVLTFHPRRPAAEGAGRVLRLALGATAIAAGCLLWQLLARAEGRSMAPGEPPPALFVDPGPCELEPVMALGAARENAEAGNAKAERYAYRVADGIVAVAFYVMAERCYQRGGDAAQAARMREESRLLKDRIESDYRLSDVKLEKALRAGDTEDALQHTRALLAFTEGTPGAYRDWLFDVRRALDERIAAKKAKKKPRIPWTFDAK